MGRRLTVDRMLLAGALFIVLAIAIRPALDNDLWWHLRSGRWMVDHRRILGADPFSHTADGDRRLPFDWLAQLGLYGVWGVGGLWLVAVATGVAATASVALTVLAVPGRATVQAAVAVLTGAAASVFWSARPRSPPTSSSRWWSGRCGGTAAPASPCGGWSPCSCSGPSSTSAGCTGSR